MDAVNIALALVLVGANGFFVATEFSVARLRPGQVDKWVRDGRPGARSVAHAVDHIDAYLAACQLGITVSSLGLGALGEPAFHHLLEPIFGESATIAGIGIASLISFGMITLLHESAAGGEIEDEEQRFSENVLTFGDRRVREVMQPRNRVVFVSTDQ